MILALINAIFKQWPQFFKQLVFIFGGFFLLIESYEVTTNNDLLISYGYLLLFSGIFSFIVFLIDGLFFAGFLRMKATLFQNNFGSCVVVQFGDLFKFSGWKTISVNDFFDSRVDDKIISSSTLHGMVIEKFWNNRSNEWDLAVANDLEGVEGIETVRPQGKTLRYPIGTTAAVEIGTEKFLFAAIANTSAGDNVTVANAENIICATRGLLRKARVVCANNDLVLPLIGSGLARAGIANKVLLDLIICGIYEELKESNITGTIRIVIHPSMYGEISLLDVKRKWN